jgi:small GTP-binding protein
LLTHARIDDKPYILGMFDTARQEDYDRLRPLTYPQTDVFLIVASIGHRNQYDSAEVKWAPELKYHCPGVPFILVGVKTGPHHDDCEREHPGLGDDVEYGKRVAKKIGALKYLECDMLTPEEVKNVFDEVRRLLYNAIL